MSGLCYPLARGTDWQGGVYSQINQSMTKTCDTGYIVDCVLENRVIADAEAELTVESLC